MYFDLHVHLGTFPASVGRKLSSDLSNIGLKIPEKGITWEKYARMADKAGVIKAMIFPFPFPCIDSAHSNDYILESTKKRNDIFIPVCLIGKDYNYFNKNIEKFAAAKDEFYINCNIEDKKYLEALGVLEELNKPLIIHASNKNRKEVLTFIGTKYPRLRVIIAHAGRRFPFSSSGVFDESVPLCKKFKNFYLETSNIGEPDAIANLTKEIEIERILYGSDFPFCSDLNYKGFYENDLNTYAHLSEEQIRKICYENARHLFYTGKWIRRCTSNDSKDIETIYRNMADEDRKFLAVNPKKDQIRKEIKSLKHTYCYEYQNQIAAFVRVSDRENNGVLLEEVYTSPEFRNKGLASALIQYLALRYSKVAAKTLSDNTAVISMLKKMNFCLIRKGVRTLDWCHG